jgi:uncharacterized DUF497 family protein
MDVGYLWDEEKYEQVRKKHHVWFYEAVSALEDPNGLDMEDPAEHTERWMWVGQTVTNRILSVIYTIEEDGPILRIITAFDAEPVIIEEYNGRQGF